MRGRTLGLLVLVVLSVLFYFNLLGVRGYIYIYIYLFIYGWYNICIVSV